MAAAQGDPQAPDHAEPEAASAERPLLVSGAPLSHKGAAQDPAAHPARGSNGSLSAGGVHALEIMSDDEAASSLGGAARARGGPGDSLLRPPTAQGNSGAPLIPPRKRNYMVVMFCLVAALLYADQNLMAPNLTAIAQDFGFDDEERDKYLGGYIAAAFYMVGAPAALLFGYLSDTVNRRNLLFAAVLLGEGPCILTFFVTKYWQLLTLRLLTGISLGGTFPLVFSLLGDLFEPRQRAAIAAVVQLATGVGLAVGQGIAGFVGSSIGWRWPFVIVAVPSIVAAVVMVLTTDEPPRGVTEHALHQAFEEGEGFVYSERISWSKVWRLVRIPTNVLVISQGLFGCLPWGMLLTFLNDYLSQNKGLTVPTATAVILVIGIGGAVGVVGGGAVGQMLYNRKKWWMPVFIGVCTLAGTPPLWVLINAPVERMVWLAFFMALLTGIMSSTVGPNMRAMMLNVNEPETRGIALALQTMLDDLGKGMGPALVAVLISHLGRTAAFNYSAAGWIPCGLLLLGTAITLERDEERMQSRLHHVVSQLLLSPPGSTTRLRELHSALEDAFAVDDADSDAGSTPRSSSGGRRYHGNGSSSRGRLKGEASALLRKGAKGGGGGETEELQHRLLTLTAQQEGEPDVQPPPPIAALPPPPIAALPPPPIAALPPQQQQQRTGPEEGSS